MGHSQKIQEIREHIDAIEDDIKYAEELMRSFLSEEKELRKDLEHLKDKRSVLFALLLEIENAKAKGSNSKGSNSKGSN